MNLVYNFSQRADAGVRIFTLGNSRDESSAVNGIAGDPFIPCDPTDTSARCPASGNTAMPNPEYGQNVGLGESTFSQSIRAYDVYSRSVLGAGSLLADFYASDNNVDLVGGGAASPYDVSHLDKRYNESLSWGRTFDTSEFAFGGYTRQESLTGLGITQTLSQSIDSYYLRGAQQFGSNLRVSAGVYDADYSTFGNSVDWRLGASYDIDSSTVVRASAGTGFRAPLLIERYYFPRSHRAPRPSPTESGLAAGGFKLRRCRPRQSGRKGRARDGVRTRPLASVLEPVEPRRIGLPFEPARHDRELLSGLFVQRTQRVRLRNSDQHRQRRVRRRRSALQARLSEAEPLDGSLLRPQRRLSVFARAERFEPDLGRHARRLRAVPGRPAAARFGAFDVGAARLACGDGVYLRGQQQLALARPVHANRRGRRKVVRPRSTLRSPRRISSTRCPGRTRCTAAAFRIRGCTPPRTAARIPRTT